MEPTIRRLVVNPCRDACGTVSTGRLFDGAPILRCPGCESEWVEIPNGSTAAPDQITERLRKSE